MPRKGRGIGESMNFIPSVAGMLDRSQMSYIPANVPGSQMGFQGLSYAPVVLDGITNMYRKHSYIPCSTSAGCGPFGSTTETVLKFNLGWWERDRSFFYYPAMLISAFYGMKYPDFREHFKIPREEFILFGDSGGYQNLSKDRNLDWKSVLRWQEENCDVIFSLDYPPTLQDSKSEREKKYRMSVASIKKVESLRKRDKIYYACTHAFSLDELKNYFDQIQNWNHFGHGQMAIRGSSTVSKIDRIVASFFLRPEGSHHFLGLSTPICITVGYFLQKIVGGRFTYDNSTYGRGAMGREYFVDNSQSIILNQMSSLRSIGCLCPVCSHLRNVEDMKGEGSVPGALISLHNLWKEIEKDRWIQSLIDSPDDLFRYLDLKSKPQNIQKRVEYIFAYEDPEKYCEKFPYKLKVDSKAELRRLDDFV